MVDPALQPLANSIEDRAMKNKMSVTWKAAAALLTACTLAACGSGDQPESSRSNAVTAASAGSALAGASKYGAVCSGCHGPVADNALNVKLATSVAALNAAIASDSQMRSLGMTLTSQDKQDITNYVAAVISGSWPTAAATGAAPGASAAGASTEWATYAGPKTMAVAHIRRLSNFEYDNAVRSLLGLEANGAATFAMDTRNFYYTRNNLQRVDDTLGAQLQAKAEGLASTAVAQKLSTILPCAVSAGATCARQFIDSFASKAFRRPLSQLERDGLYAVFTTAQTGGSFTDGVQAVIQAALQSSSFLYLTELGTAGGSVSTLDPYETASALSFLVWGAPPDDALMAAAAANALATPAARESQARRMLADPKARPQLRRMVREWLGTDDLETVSPQVTGVNYAALMPDLDREANAFIDEVLYASDGRLSTLLGADFALINAPLASHYGLSGPTGSGLVKVPLGGTARRGILTQGAFLAKHAARDNSSPVKRGVTILRRLLCSSIQFPVGDIAKQAMIMPAPSTTLTTRQRFAAHSTNPQCSGCHSQIDPLGFGLENFDQSGKYRQAENGLAIDATGVLQYTDVDGPFSDAVTLVDRLKVSQNVAQCFARNVFRFAAGSGAQSDEEALLDIARAMPPQSRDQLQELLVAYVISPAFVTRSVAP